MSRSIVYPDAFLEVRVQILEPPHPLTALCAGYDGGKWRSANLADHLFEWLPYAALSQEHQLSFASHNFLQMLRVAAAHIYNTKKTATRGELGELLLHLCCILHFGCAPVVCKLILKSSSNDTVKGFDGVHVLPRSDRFELWLGESKFYTDGREAIRESIESVRQHIIPEFLSAEKAMLFGHVGPDVPHRDAIVKLLKAQASGDQLLSVSTFPILIAYESHTVAHFKELSDTYAETLKREAAEMKAYFCERVSDLKLRFQLILVPLENKAEVVAHFDKKLGAFL